jgi:5-methyltetrahydropteroyltriglutamate--homocysteine methyltransferase
MTPDCGFATFADNPVTSAKVAEEKLRNMAQARDRLRDGNY